ncbi:hypothetical protein R6Q59_014916 [Mikania micrantha]
MEIEDHGRPNSDWPRDRTPENEGSITRLSRRLHGSRRWLAMVDVKPRVIPFFGLGVRPTAREKKKKMFVF